MKAAVYIAQVLCPDRHCILAAAMECETQEEIDQFKAEFEKQFSGLIAGKHIDPWCGICQSRHLRAEMKKTKFATLEEANPHIEALGLAQLYTRFVIDERKKAGLN